MSSVELPAVLPFQPARLSVERYHELIRVGAFTEHDRVELLCGVVTEQMPKNPPHRTATRKCDLKLSGRVPSGWHVQNQEPITLDTSEPEPDVTVIRGELEDYTHRHPGARDVALAIEVADTTLVTDRFKAEIYASAQIPVYWIVNLQDETIEVYSEPDGESQTAAYRVHKVYDREDEIPFVIDDACIGMIPVRELLP